MQPSRQMRSGWQNLATGGLHPKLRARTALAAYAGCALGVVV
jgi:hypothetical protein